ncbi:hypothetical protein LguiB_015463 [Lonicera macranthoides]
MAMMSSGSTGIDFLSIPNPNSNSIPYLRLRRRPSSITLSSSIPKVFQSLCLLLYPMFLLLLYIIHLDACLLNHAKIQHFELRQFIACSPMPNLSNVAVLQFMYSIVRPYVIVVVVPRSLQKLKWRRAISKAGAKESEEAWKETLASFKEQALKMQEKAREDLSVIAQEIREEGKKAIVVLKETSKQLQIETEKIREEINEDCMEIVEMFSVLTDELSKVSEVRDFHIGLLLSSGGFLNFMVAGSISAIRFGVILGGSLLALSVGKEERRLL